MTAQSHCLFCKIVRREIPADEVLRDDAVVAFRDVNPVAPTHLLVIPTVHAANFTAFAGGDATATGPRLLGALAELGARFGPSGYRIVSNEGPDAGQSVAHLHFHLLAGRRMTWPPG